MKTKMIYIVAALALVFSIAVVMIPASPVSAQVTWYVDDNNCPGPGTGTLADPFCRIQNAIGNATAGDTIIIAAGTYNEHDITINKSLTLRGAGAGSTFVDGQDKSRVFYINNSTVDMSGMTIRNGNLSVTSEHGGGLYNNGGNMTMTNCTVSGNEARNGGGLYNNGGNVTMTSCTISENEANFWGGGIYRDGGEVTLTNCTVSGNTALSGMLGGGIYNEGDTGDGLTMTSCNVSDNKAENDGGGIWSNAELTMTNCTISGNEAPRGGGIYNGENSEMTMTGCTVSGNTAGGFDGDGGGIYNGYGNVTMTGCTVSGNEADDGGGIYNDGGQVTMTDCTISDNEAGGDGGGIRNEDGRVDMTNCTVSGNNADNGGGIYTHMGLTTLTNCTVSNNSAQNWGGGVYNEGTGEADYVQLRCTIIYGNADADTDTCYDNYYGEYIDIGGESIVDECLGSTLNPLLGPLRDNGGPTETHALMAGSPAIDACINECTVDTDQRGQPRPVDGDLDGTIYCDVGAYEKQISVGGIVEPVDKIGIVAPWIALAALIVVAMAVLVVAKRRRVA